MTDLLGKLQRWANVLETTALLLLLTAMLGLAGTQIILRNVFDAGLTWADPMIRALVLWVGLVGAVAAARHKKHIRIDLLSRYLRGRAVSLATALGDGFAALVAAFVAWHAFRMVGQEIEFGGVAFAAIPSWVVQSVIPISFALIALSYLIAAIATVTQGWSGRAAS